MVPPALFPLKISLVRDTFTPHPSLYFVNDGTIKELNVATVITRNLKLRINDNLTADSKYNLNRIDALGAIYHLDTADAVNIRSSTDITLSPENASVGGSGVGGSITLGNASQRLSLLAIFAQTVQFDGSIGYKDQGTGGTRYLNIQYKSDVSGSTDTTADRTLSIDMEGANRSLRLGGNFEVTGGNLLFTLSGNSTLTAPLVGTLATLAGVETLTNKTIDANNNTINNIANANVAAGAAIAYSKLNLVNGVTNADINSAAAIAYSKLALANSVVNSDIASSAAISYSKLALGNSIGNADISVSAGIAYSKLNLSSSIVNADVAAAAAIAGTKISPNFGNQQITTASSLRFQQGGFDTTLRPAQSGQAANLIFDLPPDDGTVGQVLQTDGNGVTSWTSVLTVGNQSANTVFAGPTSGGAAAPAFRALVAADFNAIVGREMSATWLAADGTTKTITHSYGTRKVLVEVLDADDNYATIAVQTIERPTDNTVVLTSNTPPAVSWVVLIKEII